jgi:sulfite reductase alpha subunit-like flavoprotein
LYGSETGTAEEVAFKIHGTLLKQHLNCLISSMDDYDISLLPSETCIVWVVATAGEGEVPSSMKKLWNFLLKKSLSSDSLQGVSSAVFGLGDSSYEKFNAAGRFVVFRYALYYYKCRVCPTFSNHLLFLLCIIGD